MAGKNPNGESGKPPVSRERLIAAFAAIYVIWGSTYLAIRFAVETLPPLSMAGVRFLLAGSLVYVWARWRGAPRPAARHWVSASVIGALLLLGGNGAVVCAAHLLPSGVSSLIVATTPFFLVGIEWARPRGVRPTPRVLLGLAVGFAGLALLVGPSAFEAGGEVNPLGAGILLVGTLCWSSGSIYSRHAQLPRAPLLGIGMEQLAGGALLLVAGLASGEGSRFDPAAISLVSVAAFAYLVVLGSLVGYSAYIWLLSVSTPARVSTYAYVNPLIALLLGGTLGGETFGPRTLLASAVIVLAVATITVDPRRKARRSTEKEEARTAGDAPGAGLRVAAAKSSKAFGGEIVVPVSAAVPEGR
jgi:drug/metabolite transporter (DMT)-like permease